MEIKKRKSVIKELKVEFATYLEKCKTNKVQSTNSKGEDITKIEPKIPTIKDFWCIHLGKDWAKWQKALVSKRLGRTCKIIKDQLEAKVLDSLINGEGNSTGLIFDLKANYGYTDAQLKGDESGIVKTKKIEISVRTNNENGGNPSVYKEL